MQCSVGAAEDSCRAADTERWYLTHVWPGQEPAAATGWTAWLRPGHTDRQRRTVTATERLLLAHLFDVVVPADGWTYVRFVTTGVRRREWDEFSWSDVDAIAPLGTPSAETFGTPTEE
ncbi:hypothetical protein [Georgenia sp. AZ-5]|uniref:hypothetical protein n=1 Tax=Georgenia sp. AZ-5 TaxID=3367526 RepID=UPI003754B439